MVLRQSCARIKISRSVTSESCVPRVKGWQTAAEIKKKNNHSLWGLNMFSIHENFLTDFYYPVTEHLIIYFILKRVAVYKHHKILYLNWFILSTIRWWDIFHWSFELIFFSRQEAAWVQTLVGVKNLEIIFCSSLCSCLVRRRRE